MIAGSIVRPQDNCMKRAACMWTCSLLRWFHFILICDTFEPGYNDISLCDTSYITSDVSWCQFISHYGPKLYIPRLEKRPFITIQDMHPSHGVLTEFDRVFVFLYCEMGLLQHMTLWLAVNSISGVAPASCVRSLTYRSSEVLQT